MAASAQLHALPLLSPARAAASSYIKPTEWLAHTSLQPPQSQGPWAAGRWGPGLPRPGMGLFPAVERSSCRASGRPRRQGSSAQGGPAGAGRAAGPESQAPSTARTPAAPRGRRFAFPGPPPSCPVTAQGSAVSAGAVGQETSGRCSRPSTAHMPPECSVLTEETPRASAGLPCLRPIFAGARAL